MKHLINAIRYSIQGLRTCFRDEVAFRQECLLAIPHFLFLFLLPLSGYERLYLTIVWVLVLAAELLNTSIEAIVNLVSPEKHPLAGKAKDCGSAAVFCLLILLFLSWGVLLTRYFLTNI